MKNKEFYNFFTNIPKFSNNELFETIIQNKKIKIERIVSYGQVTSENYWYDQDEDEFVIVLDGKAILEYEDNRQFVLEKGDSLYIQAHQKHRVIYTANPTVWMAVFITK